jgi:hypothetical protein
MRPEPTRTAAAVLVALVVPVALVVLAAAPAVAQYEDGGGHQPIWEELDQDRREAARQELESGPEVREPFFAFLVEAVYADSLGTWTGQDLLDFARGHDSVSRFPVEAVVKVERRRPRAREQQSWPESAVRAVWEVELAEDLDRSMPYSILGYHPGSLRVSRRLLLTEVSAGRMALHQGEGAFLATDAVLFRVDAGHVILDVDGLVDRLLGKALDDAATVGFVLAREQGRLLGLAVSLGKDGRRIFGEFDFRQDRILPNGRPEARALSSAARQRMLAGYSGPPLGAWVDD